MARRSKLHVVNVRGVGRLSVSGKLPRYKKLVLVAGKAYPITKQSFLEAWALSRKTGRSFRELLAERVSLPPSHGSAPDVAYARELTVNLGRPPTPDELAVSMSRGLSPEFAAINIRRHREEEEKEDR
jgi:hypothetical protein